MHDLVIRGGTLVDGSGETRRSGDVAIDGGRIVAVGEVDGHGRNEIDADGAVVTPGFVDVHTHYDGQATWDGDMTPSVWHGVTTVVFGNCGVGFAPARPEEHDWLISLMEGVEDIPGTALAEGISWGWESFPEYLDAIERRDRTIDIAAQVPHGALRAYVMGRRGADHTEAPTPDEIEQMAQLVAEALDAGAMGFTTSRTRNHRTADGEFTPSLTAEPAELLGITDGLRRTAKGVMQLVSDFDDVASEVAIMRALAERSNRPLSVTVAQSSRYPDQWREILDLIAAAQNDGVAMKAQIATRPIGLLYGLQATFHPFVTHPSYRAIAELPLAERVAAMRTSELRTAILSEHHALRGQGKFMAESFDRMFPLGDPPNYEPPPESSVEAKAKAAGVEPAELLYDLMLEGEGRSLLYFPLANYANFDLEATREMMLDEHTVFGLSDGGAHVGLLCDASFPTSQLTHWGRDRSRGDGLPLEFLVKGQTAETAALVGLNDRGRLVAGAKGDVNIIDIDRLQLRAPEMVFDLPAGGKRLIQRADGYVATIVSGDVIVADGELTGAEPGTLVRGAQPAPS